MPIYEYLCSNPECQHRFELLQKLSESDPDRCPVCSQASLSRALNAPRFQLKGTGWYISDFRDSKKPVPGGAAAEPEQNKESSDAKTDNSKEKAGADAKAESTGQTSNQENKATEPRPDSGKPPPKNKLSESSDSSRPTA